MWPPPKAIKDMPEAEQPEVLEWHSRLISNEVNFEKIFSTVELILKPLAEQKKMRAILDYDPQKRKIEVDYYAMKE